VSPVAYALFSSVAWGTADFVGGAYTRRLPLAGVLVVTQTGAVAAGVVAAALFGGLTPVGLALGALGGVFGAAGLMAYWRALAVGTMGVVAPISALCALIPLALGLASGERPAALRLAGGLVAFGGAVLASFHEHRGGGDGRRSVLLAGATAVLFGLLLYLLSRASDHGGVGSALLGSRVATAAVLGGWMLSLRPEIRFGGGRTTLVLLIGGTLSASANGVFALATERGQLSLVALLASIYPVTTVVLARATLAERLTKVQLGGVLVAFAGVALVAVG
jgi:drug/metabolite transporter (DMT)-like permease